MNKQSLHAGDGLINLVEWLKAASIEREAGLLKALSQVPMPKKVPVEGDPRSLHCCLTMPWKPPV